MLAFRIVAVTASCIVGLATGVAQPPGNDAERGGPRGGRQGPVYQRRAFDWNKGPGHRERHSRDDSRFKDFKNRRHVEQRAPNVQSGWFQRPYPYHLDFYKMKYGGSYAPYFGNLYGPPQVVTAPPYYGPYYGGGGAENGGWGYGTGGNPPGEFGETPAEQLVSPGEVLIEGPVVQSPQNNQPAPQTNGEHLPAPGR
jgi:hypothetical protein